MPCNNDENIKVCAILTLMTVCVAGFIAAVDDDGPVVVSQPVRQVIESVRESVGGGVVAGE